ncbi:12558_t:CDS:1 [Funneliformis mosseae]|uniref:12558_t:CDS:1 n=1 Tax=Funneliformis mosseae TaxID=27381 RepID=A0A9N9HW61_FUNMO|nr:12558_t:CDS:1 [Funneliformis mosseae]
MSSLTSTKNINISYLNVEIKVNIFKYVNTPLNLALSSKEWSIIARDTYAKTEWLIQQFGKAHAFFHGIRLGPAFINKNVCQSLFIKKAIFSRYLTQKLVIHYGLYDLKLVELKIKNNIVDRSGAGLVLHKYRNPWAGNLPLEVFLYLLKEGAVRFENQYQKGNDMELFHYLSAGPNVINYAPNILEKNFEKIKDLILKQRFVPFPPRPKPFQLNQKIVEEYPPKDGYENSRQLNVIARAILLESQLVGLWKEIGYNDICSDINDIVLEGAMLILFPPTPPLEWICPSVDQVVTRLNNLIELGFDLSNKIVMNILQLFEHRLDDIGETIWNAFTTIRTEETTFSFVFGLFREAFEPTRCQRKLFIINFLKSKTEQHDLIIKQILEQRFNDENIDDFEFRSRRKSLILSPQIYEFILNTYGNESDLTLMCFKDILFLKIYYDDPLNASLAQSSTTESIDAIYDIYKQKIPKNIELLKHTIFHS